MKYEFDWSELAFASSKSPKNKKTVKDLNATFIAAPREISAKRFTQLVKQLLPKGNIVIGLAKEDYIDGFENQPQFKTLRQSTIQSIITKTNAAAKHKIYVLHYFQREAPFVLEKLRFHTALFVNGSWKYTFHTTAVYYTLMRSKTRYELISPFVDEEEARAYSKATEPKCLKTFVFARSHQTEEAMLAHAEHAARLSFDYNFQTGATLGEKLPEPNSYRPVAFAYNEVVPYQTYAMHHGASRETHFSPPHDLNHYDTVHAEVEMILGAARGRFKLDGATLFVNLMPCPTCARMLSDTKIAEIVYSLDHSDGYAIQILEKAGKKVRRIVG